MEAWRRWVRVVLGVVGRVFGWRSEAVGLGVVMAALGLGVLGGSVGASAEVSVAPASADAPSVASPAVVGAAGREIAALRTRRSRTYATGDGKYRASLFAASVNFKDAEGRWQPIDNTRRVSGLPCKRLVGR
jgi:hypothetical protein